VSLTSFEPLLRRNERVETAAKLRYAIVLCYICGSETNMFSRCTALIFCKRRSGGFVELAAAEAHQRRNERRWGGAQ
jgi:hypothetical protein